MSARQRKPKPPAMHDGDPCEKCGGVWYFTAITMDPEATELEAYAVCVACHHAPDRPAAVSDQRGSAE